MGRGKNGWMFVLVYACTSDGACRCMSDAALKHTSRETGRLGQLVPREGKIALNTKQVKMKSKPQPKAEHSHAPHTTEQKDATNGALECRRDGQEEQQQRPIPRAGFGFDPVRQQQSRGRAKTQISSEGKTCEKKENPLVQYPTSPKTDLKTA